MSKVLHSGVFPAFSQISTEKHLWIAVENSVDIVDKSVDNPQNQTYCCGIEFRFQKNATE